MLERFMWSQIPERVEGNYEGMVGEDEMGLFAGCEFFPEHSVELADGCFRILPVRIDQAKHRKMSSLGDACGPDELVDQ